MIIIRISKDYTEEPGGRYKKDGAFSGEEFRETILYPKYREAIQSGEKIQINLDDCYEFPSSFIEEAFGGLARQTKNVNLLNYFEFISEDEPSLVDKIKRCIANALNKENINEI